MIENKIQTRTIQQPTQQDNTKTLEKVAKWISGIILGAMLLFIIILKINIPSFPLFWTILIGVIIILFYAAVWLSFAVFKRKKDNKVEEVKINKAISLEQAKAIALSAVINPEWADYLNYSIEGLGVVHSGKTKDPIFWLKAYGPYEKKKYAILLNMSYPVDKRVILIEPFTDTDFERAIKSLASIPEEIPLRETTHEVAPLLGIERTIEKEVKEEEKKEEVKKKEDLV